MKILVNPASMLKSVQKHLSLVIVILVSLAFVSFALANEADTRPILAQAGTGTQGEPAPRPGPLDLVRQRAAQIKQNTVDAKAQLRADTQVELQAAQTPEERRAILQGSAGARVDIAQEGRPETAGMVQRVRDAVRQHAGLIKERFALAIRQFDSLAARIESRLDKMAARGVATASVEAELEVAKAANAEAKADVQAVTDFIAGVEEGSDRAEVRAQLQPLVREAQASIKTAHQALQKVVRSLVQLAKDNRSSTDTPVSVEAETDATVTE